MTDAGDKLTSAMERHAASVEASRDSARQLASERDAELAAASGEATSPPLTDAAAPATTEPPQ